MWVCRSVLQWYTPASLSPQPHPHRYFATIADTLMGPHDQVILLTHQPTWLLGWYWGRHMAPNLQQLIRRHLRGRARLHIAGDLHFYMRHSARHATAAPRDVGGDAAEGGGAGMGGPGEHEGPFHDVSQDSTAPAMLGGLYAWDAASPWGGSPRGRSPLGGSPRDGSPLRGQSPVRGPLEQNGSMGMCVGVCVCVVHALAPTQHGPHGHRQCSNRGCCCCGTQQHPWYI